MSRPGWRPAWRWRARPPRSGNCSRAAPVAVPAPIRCTAPAARRRTSRARVLRISRSAVAGQRAARARRAPASAAASASGISQALWWDSQIRPRSIARRVGSRSRLERALEVDSGLVEPPEPDAGQAVRLVETAGPGRSCRPSRRLRRSQEAARACCGAWFAEGQLDRRPRRPVGAVRVRRRARPARSGAPRRRGARRRRAGHPSRAVAISQVQPARLVGVEVGEQRLPDPVVDEGVLAVELAVMRLRSAASRSTSSTWRSSVSQIAGEVGGAHPDAQRGGRGDQQRPGVGAEASDPGERSGPGRCRAGPGRRGRPPRAPRCPSSAGSARRRRSRARTRPR